MGAFSMWVFAGLNLFCLIFLIRFVPETRGVALEDIEQRLADRLNLHAKEGNALSSAQQPHLGDKS